MHPSRYAQPSTAHLIGGPEAARPAPVNFSAELQPDVAGGLHGAHRSYAERANQARGSNRGPRSGASSFAAAWK